MDRYWSAALFAAAVSVWPVIVRAELTLDIDRALATARERAPALVAARSRIDEARGRLIGASVLLRDNPELEGIGGRRMSRGGDFDDVDATLTQRFELGSRRAARIAGANAGIARETANSDDETRRLLRDVATAFWRIVAAEERLRLLRTNERLASELAQTAEHRHRAGDIADLDRNLAVVAKARAAADVHAAEACATAVAGELKILLGIDAAESVLIRGELAKPPHQELSAMLARAEDRPDIRAIEAEIREADADVRLGEGFRWPDVGAVVGYRRDTGDDIPSAGFTVTLPLFARGQELRATGAARGSRLRLELAAKRRAVETEVRTAFAGYERHRAAVDDLERGANLRLDENERLAQRGYDAREISLPELLILRREALATRTEYVDRLLDLALAAVDLEARAGVLR
jgi:cobalt-zinc-cadmium efflux system outer membrane protein